jgi:hypothetical protein
VRRFIESLPGRICSHFVVCTLLLPTLTLALAFTKAEAQVQEAQIWAVVPFRDLRQPGSPYGAAAADAFRTEFAAAFEVALPGQRPEVLAQETVVRGAETLGIELPPVTETNLLRLGQTVMADRIVSGQVAHYDIVEVNGGRQARAWVRVIVHSVRAGTTIRGAVVEGAESTVRPAGTPDDVLIGDALVAAARQAVPMIQAQSLPVATVLNTQGERIAYINRGAREGFRVNQQVVITRGRQQVATARVTEVEPDNSVVRVERSLLGMAPGDRVEAVFEVPELILPRAGTPPVVQRRATARGGGDILTAALVVGGILLLVAGPGRGGQRVVGNLTAEATQFPDQSGIPAVRLSWQGGAFAGGNAQRALWQIYRSDVQNIPVLVVPGEQTFAFDTAEPRGGFAFAAFPSPEFPIAGGTICRTTVATNATAPEVVPGVMPGRPYQYQAALVYALSDLDLPGDPAGEVCYFISARTTARGTATPLARPAPVAPGPNAVIGQPTTFTFQSVVNPAFPIQVEYVVQISSSPQFTRASTVTVTRMTRGDTGTLATETVDTLGSRIPVALRNAQELWWRVGARNVADRPGPVPDPSGERYIFSAAQRFTRPVPPPPPPGTQPPPPPPAMP